MTSSIVTVFVRSPDTRSERRFDNHITVNQLKNKLEPITGIPSFSQTITLHAPGTADDDNAPVLAVLSDDQKPLGYYSIQDWQVLKVKDERPASISLTGQYTDVSQVEKFEISNEDYAARRDTVLAYKQAHNVGRFAPVSTTQSPQPHTDISVGSRCEVDTDDGSLKRRGMVRFVGQTRFAPGIWVGIEYDEPLGKNDGSVQGTRYFDTRPLYGGFLRPDRVRVGDFPVKDLELDEHDEM